MEVLWEGDMREEGADRILTLGLEPTEEGMYRMKAMATNIRNSSPRGRGVGPMSLNLDKELVWEDGSWWLNRKLGFTETTKNLERLHLKRAVLIALGSIALHGGCPDAESVREAMSEDVVGKVVLAHLVMEG